MVDPQLLLSWIALLCCAVNAESLAVRTYPGYLNTSSTTSQQQYASTKAAASLNSPSSSEALNVPSSFPISRINPADSYASSSPLSSDAGGPGVPGTLHVSIIQPHLSDAGIESSMSAPPVPTAFQQTSGGARDEPSTTLPTSTPARMSDSEGGPTPPGTLSSSPGSSVSVPSAVGPINATASSPPSFTLPPPRFSSTSGHFNTSSPSKYYNTSMTVSHYVHPNATTISVFTPSTSQYPSNFSTACTPYTPGETITVFSIVPNTNTLTITVYANQSTTYKPTSTPEFTPPPSACPFPASSPPAPPIYTSSAAASGRPTIPFLPSASASPASSMTGTWSDRSGSFPSETTGALLSITVPLLTTVAGISDGHPFTSTYGQWWSDTMPLPNFPTTTVVITSKNPHVVFTTATPPRFPGGAKTDRQTAVPTSHGSGYIPLMPHGDGGTGGSNPANGVGSSSPGTGGGSSGTPSTVKVGGVTVVIAENSVQIGGQTVAPLPWGTSTVLEEGGETFTVGPSQIFGPGTILAVPTSAGGGVFQQGPSPTPTVVDGVFIAVGSGDAVIGGKTYGIGAEAPGETIVISGKTISVGPGGVGFLDMTITPPATLPTNVVLFDGSIYSAIGASVAVFDGQSITYTGGAVQTTIFNGDTITVGPDGVVDGTTTLGGPKHPTGTTLGIAGGLAVTEIGASLAVVDGMSLTVGPDASETTATIHGKTITARSSGLIIDGSTTLNYPFNLATQIFTAGGITFSEIGPSLVDIGGTTFTIGPGAPQTTDVYNGQTISIGPSGIGFATTTIPSFATESTPAATSGKKKNAAATTEPHFVILGACIAFGFGILG